MFKGLLRRTEPRRRPVLRGPRQGSRRTTGTPGKPWNGSTACATSASASPCAMRSPEARRRRPRALLCRQGIRPVPGSAALGKLRYAELPQGPRSRSTAIPRGRAPRWKSTWPRPWASCKIADGMCRLHFTVSPDHESAIHATLDAARRRYQAAGVQFLIDLSQQKPSTDTLAADQDNAPLRNPDGTLVFRPGGHGALLENLFHTGGDIVFIKNIDNVVPDRLRPAVLGPPPGPGRLPGAPAGTRLRLPGTPARGRKAGRRRFRLPGGGGGPFRGTTAGRARLPKTCAAPRRTPRPWPPKPSSLIKSLDRPLRVCAMVKNQGEPGGGPFWVRAKDGACARKSWRAPRWIRPRSQQRKIMEVGHPFQSRGSGRAACATAKASSTSCRTSWTRKPTSSPPNPRTARPSRPWSCRAYGTDPWRSGIRFSWKRRWRRSTR